MSVSCKCGVFLGSGLYVGVLHSVECLSVIVQPRYGEDPNKPGLLRHRKKI